MFAHARVSCHLWHLYIHTLLSAYKQNMISTHAVVSLQATTIILFIILRLWSKSVNLFTDILIYHYQWNHSVVLSPLHLPYCLSSLSLSVGLSCSEIFCLFVYRCLWCRWAPNLTFSSNDTLLCLLTFLLSRLLHLDSYDTPIPSVTVKTRPASSRNHYLVRKKRMNSFNVNMVTFHLYWIT